MVLDVFVCVVRGSGMERKDAGGQGAMVCLPMRVLRSFVWVSDVYCSWFVGDFVVSDVLWYAPLHIFLCVFFVWFLFSC